MIKVVEIRFPRSSDSCSLLSQPLGPIRVADGEFLESQSGSWVKGFMFSTVQGLAYLRDTNAKMGLRSRESQNFGPGARKNKDLTGPSPNALI